MKFLGNKEAGYSVNWPTYSVRVFRTTGGWKATYNGDPKNNPIEIKDGVASRSCVCPLVTVEGTFKSRKEAATRGMTEEGSVLRASTYN